MDGPNLYRMFSQWDQKLDATACDVDQREGAEMEMQFQWNWQSISVEHLRLLFGFGRGDFLRILTGNRTVSPDLHALELNNKCPLLN